MRRGFTLVEMLVVLSILAVLTLVAVQATENFGQQARFDVTQTTLNNIRAAIVGDPTLRNSDGTPRVTGYIANTGRLPTGTTLLNELLVQPMGLATSAVQVFDSDRDLTNDVSLSSGWNGPYIRLSVAQTDVLDGWGNPFSVTNGPPYVVTSHGSDGDSTGDETIFNEDISLSIALSEYQGTLKFQMFEISSGSRVDPAALGATEALAVLVYGVNAAGGTTGTVQESVVGLTTLATVSPTFQSTWQTTIGNVAARAVRWTDTNGNGVVDIGETISKKSYLHYLTVTAGVTQNVALELR